MIPWRLSSSMLGSGRSDIAVEIIAWDTATINNEQWMVVIVVTVIAVTQTILHGTEKRDGE